MAAVFQQSSVQPSFAIHEGAPATFIGITRDITERMQAMEAEKRLIQLKEEFIASVSHDLRTPLFSLIGYLDLLRNGKVKDPEVQNEFLTRASKDVDRLMDMVNELLDVSRLESNRLVLNLEEVDLGRSHLGSVAIISRTSKCKADFFDVCPIGSIFDC